MAQPDTTSVKMLNAAQMRMIGAVIWKASPLLCTLLLGITLLNGLIPVGTILISSALLNVIVQAIAAPHPTSVLPGGFIALLVMLGVIILLSRLCDQLRLIAEGLYQKRVTNYITILIAEHASTLDLTFFENPEQQNQLSNASSEASYRPVLIVNQLCSAFSALVTLISVMVVILLWHVWIIPIILLSSLLTFVISARFGKSRAQLALALTSLTRSSRYIGMLLTSDTAAKEVRLFGLRTYFLSRYRLLLDTIYQQERRIARSQFISTGVASVALSAVRPALIAFVAIQTLERTTTLGQFNLYTQSITQFEAGISILMMTLAQLYENNLFITNLFRFLELRPQVEAPRLESVQRRAAISAHPVIEFRDVSFHYHDNPQMIINHLSLRIEPGEVLAIVGENGAGKTTLVKLLAGLYQPTAGQILLDGVDIMTLDRADLRAYLGVIFQDYAIYHFSAADNIGVGRIEHIDDDERIKTVARRSGFATVVNTLPQRYETVLGRFIERGHELSGGQRQLVAIARALMRAAPVLILDEPSSALDTRNEMHFFQQLLEERESADQSIVFISHRFSTVRRAERIVVLEHGTIIEEGTHQELMKRQGRYAELFTAQVRMYGDPRELGMGHPADETIETKPILVNENAR